MSDDPIRVGDTTLEEIEDTMTEYGCASPSAWKDLCALVRAQAAEIAAMTDTMRGYDADIPSMMRQIADLTRERDALVQAARALVDHHDEVMRVSVDDCTTDLVTMWNARAVHDYDVLRALLPAAPEEGR